MIEYQKSKYCFASCPLPGFDLRCSDTKAKWTVAKLFNDVDWGGICHSISHQSDYVPYLAVYHVSSSWFKLFFHVLPTGFSQLSQATTPHHLPDCPPICLRIQPIEPWHIQGRTVLGAPPEESVTRHVFAWSVQDDLVGWKYGHELRVIPVGGDLCWT